MKKSVFTAALVFAAVFVLGGCGGNISADGSGKKPATDDRIYNNVADFSSKQGWQGWHYLYRDSMGEIYKMTFDLDTGRWNGRDFYCYNRIGEQHPGNNTETLIGWQATVDGSVSVAGTVVRNPVDFSGDGVFYYVTLNDREEDDYLFSVVVEEDEKTPYKIEFTADVKAGDMLYFCINGNANNSFDSTCSNITIQYR